MILFGPCDISAASFLHHFLVFRPKNGSGCIPERRRHLRSPTFKAYTDDATERDVAATSVATTIWVSFSASCSIFCWYKLRIHKLTCWHSTISELSYHYLLMISFNLTIISHILNYTFYYIAIQLELDVVKTFLTAVPIRNQPVEG